MSPSLSSIVPEYVGESFLVATHNPLFHGCWMSAETWCNLLKKKIYINNTSLEFNGQTLIKALGLKKYKDLKMEMEVEKINVTCDHIGLFSGKYRQKKKQANVFFIFMPPLRGKSQKQREVNGVIILVT